MAIKSDSALVLLGRTIWIMFGPLLLTANALFMLLHPGRGWASGASITYIVALVLMVAGRYLEHLGGNPKTSTGEPSTPVDLSRYILCTLVVGLAFWVVANLIANYVLV